MSVLLIATTHDSSARMTEIFSIEESLELPNDGPIVDNDDQDDFCLENEVRSILCCL